MPKWLKIEPWHLRMTNPPLNEATILKIIELAEAADCEQAKIAAERAREGTRERVANFRARQRNGVNGHDHD